MEQIYHINSKVNRVLIKISFKRLIEVWEILPKIILSRELKLKYNLITRLKELQDNIQVLIQEEINLSEIAFLQQLEM